MDSIEGTDGTGSKTAIEALSDEAVNNVEAGKDEAAGAIDRPMGKKYTNVEAADILGIREGSIRNYRKDLKVMIR